MQAADDTAASPAAALVVIAPGRASLEVLLGAVDAALASGLAGVQVEVPLARDDARHERLMALTSADPRVKVVEPGTTSPPAQIRFDFPANARPSGRTLVEIAELLRERGLAAVSVPVPGRYPALTRFGRHGRLSAATEGSGSATLRPAEVGLRSIASPDQPGPPPKGVLAAERAEHLRHRARAATMRARLARNSHRLSRERLQTRHERARLRQAEQRLAATGSGEWVRWRARSVGRRARAVPGLAINAALSVRSFFRRARRYIVNRVRTRRMEA